MRGSERQQEAGEGAVGTQSQSKGHVGPEDANRSSRGPGNREAAFLRTRGVPEGGVRCPSLYDPSPPQPSVETTGSDNL